MLKLMKYLKKSTFPIILIFGLLILQAYCDLSLPSYTSDIVNVGIQQGGITESSPEVVRESTMNHILLFTTDEEKDNILNSYNYIDKGQVDEGNVSSYLEKYPLLATENLYVRKENLTNTDFEGAMSKALMLYTSLSTESDTAKAMKEALSDSIPAEMKDLSMVEILAMMPAEQRAAIVEPMKEQFAQLPESMLTSGATAVIKAEYKAVGLDTDHIQTSYITRTGLKMLGLAMVGMVTSIIVGFIASRIAATFAKDLRSMTFRKVVSFSNTEFDKFSTASLITRSTNDIQQVQMLIVMFLRMVAYAPILGIGGVFKVLNTNVSMAWVIALAVILIMIFVITLFSLAMPKFKKMQKLVDRLNLVTREILTGLPVIRAFSTEKYEEKRFDKANRDLTKTSLFVNRVMTFMMPAMMFLMNGTMILILWEGGHGIDTGDMMVGDMMAFIQYAMQIIMSFLMICMISIFLPRAAVSGKRISEVLDTDLSIIEAKDTKEFDNSKKGYVEFNHVSFRYPGAEEDVLHDITFTAKPGETTAIIGSTGSGKSTLIQLIPRLYDITEGELLVNGVDVRKVSSKNLRDKIGYVPQKGVLFTGTISSNLRFGKQNASEEDVHRAARIAQASDFIEAKTDKYDELISQGGSNVSGGQKQRLSIARAIAKDPEIYIFDDSFSALDYKTDVVLRKTLRDEITKSTMIIVAQRISTIMNAEQIIVLDEGRIVGKGTHKELLKSCDVYKQIASSQLSSAELEQDER
ncbi:ABC transporter ATP-binding protein [Clostridium sp. Marseille-P299]|uniref:ABC transporter ATP-binding protein n=1 Tax=Clostridium sp. Marseille-P299 TaxID=1805477 RepID=UPI000832A52C|nr:ABC transporter ATP-binding protein [Clostridium sp. Marseille-P299]